MFFPSSLIALFFASFFLVSCVLPPVEPVPAIPGVPTAEAVGVPKTPEQLEKEAKRRAERVKANAEAKARRDALEAENAGGRVDPIEPGTRNPIPNSRKYRTAMSIPGKDGYVFNPWTNKAVDVRGLPKGALIRDPNDGNPDHKFRVP